MKTQSGKLTQSEFRGLIRMRDRADMWEMYLAHNSDEFLEKQRALAPEDPEQADRECQRNMTKNSKLTTKIIMSLGVESDARRLANGQLRPGRKV